MLLINEWLPNPEGSDTTAEWVELWNNGASAVNVKGWAIATSNGKKHALPEVVIPPGGYRVVSRAEGKFVLKNENETVMLYAPSGAREDASSFLGSAPEGMSFNRGAPGFFAQPTPGAANAAPPQAHALATGAVTQATGNISDAVGFASPIFLAFGVAACIALAIMVSIRKDETLSKLFFGGDETYR